MGPKNVLAKSTWRDWGLANGEWDRGFQLGGKVEIRVRLGGEWGRGVWSRCWMGTKGIS